jgi:hypothetical protein
MQRRQSGRNEILLELRRSSTIGGSSGSDRGLSPLQCAGSDGLEVLLELRQIARASTVQELPGARSAGIEILLELRHPGVTAAEYYPGVYRNLRKKGQPIPTNDMWIAATALQHGLAVYAYDSP